MKASYVFNFIRYVEWPANTLSDPNEAIEICFYGEGLPADAFDSLDGMMTPNAGPGDSVPRDIQVRQRAGAADVAGCHVLFVGAASPPTVSHALLVVGDTAGFAQSGGMIGLVKVKNRFAFAINLAAADAGGLKIRSNLLKLATNVIN